MRPGALGTGLYVGKGFIEMEKKEAKFLPAVIKKLACHLGTGLVIWLLMRFFSSLGRVVSF